MMTVGCSVIANARCDRGTTTDRMAAISHSGHLKILGSTKEALSTVAVAPARALPPAGIGRASRSPRRPATGRSPRHRSDTKRGAVQHVFALAAALSKPKYNRLALEFVSSY
jgi:hypothetical protein